MIFFQNLWHSQNIWNLCYECNEQCKILVLLFGLLKFHYCQFNVERSYLSIFNQFFCKYWFKKSIVCFWKILHFKLSTTPPSPSLTTMHSTLHSVHHRKTGRETISLKLNDPLKNRYEPSRRSLNRKQRLFLYPQSFAVPSRVSFFIIYMPHFLPRFHEVETIESKIWKYRLQLSGVGDSTIILHAVAVQAHTLLTLLNVPYI